MLLTDKVSQFATDSNTVHAWVNGPASGVGSSISTSAGLVRTPAKLIADNQAGFDQITALVDRVKTVDLAAPTGASLVGYLPAGTGAVATTTQSKLRESVSVKDFGAVGDGVTDDTVAFSAAAKNAQAVNNIPGAEGFGVPRALMCKVHVPSGTYLVSSEVDTGGREVTWIVDQGALIINYSYLNGKILREGQRQNDYHHGTTDYACGYSVRNNVGLEEPAEVLGISTPAQLAAYTDRDTVGLYVDNTSPLPVVSASSAIYTSTTVAIATPTVATRLKYRKGMIIDTNHSPNKWSGVVDAWNADGSVITVTAWYQVGGGGIASTPANDGTGCVINGFTKVWAHNANVFLNTTGNATKACGFELGMFNNRGDAPTDLTTISAENTTWGYDSVNLGGKYGQCAFISRGLWRYGYVANGSDVGFVAKGGGTPFRATNFNSDAYWTVNSTGSMEMGYKKVANSQFLDFNTSGNNNDYDGRFFWQGGTTAGTATLDILTGKARVSGSMLVNSANVVMTGFSAGTSKFEVVSDSNSTVAAVRRSVGDANTAVLTIAKDRAGTDILANEGVGEIRFEAFGGGGYRQVANIYAGSEGEISATTSQGTLLLRVTKAGSTTPTTALRITAAHEVRPNADNAQTLGSVAYRWSVVYAGTATISTSDDREKTYSEIEVSEVLVAKELKTLMRRFKFNDAIALKGEESARIHFGASAQTVVATFAKHGLDATKYAMLCYDEWDEQQEVKDEEGNVIQEYRAAGNRYGIRYEELLAFIIGAM